MMRMIPLMDYDWIYFTQVAKLGHRKPSLSLHSDFNGCHTLPLPLSRGDTRVAADSAFRIRAKASVTGYRTSFEFKMNPYYNPDTDK